MNRSGRLAPYVLLSILTLGAGVGVGLGLSEGPVTNTPTAASRSEPCSSSVTSSGVQLSCREGTVSDANGYQSQMTVWFKPSEELPPSIATCVNGALHRTAPREPKSLDTFERELTGALASCGVPKGEL